MCPEVQIHPLPAHGSPSSGFACVMRVRVSEPCRVRGRESADVQGGEWRG